jgi:hypothetical protein
MRIFLFLLALTTLASPLASPLASAFAQPAHSEYRLHVYINDSLIDWQVLEPATRAGDVLRVPAGTEQATVTFAGGMLVLNLADVQRWDYAHVLGTRWQPTNSSNANDPDTYTVHATVRHADAGWDNYANIFRVVPASDASQVSNGVRELLHPHDNEQPFTRSQRGVQAVGQVRVEAADNVEGWGGSTITLTLAELTFPVDIRWQLELTNP